MRQFPARRSWAASFLAMSVGLLLTVDAALALDFSAPLNLSQTPGFSWMGRVIAADERVYVVWSESGTDWAGVALRESLDRGKTFGQVHFFPGMTPSSRASGPMGLSLWASGPRLYMAWLAHRDETRNEIFFTSYDSLDQADALPHRLSDGPHRLGQPLVALDAQRIYVVWLAESLQSPGQRVIEVTWSHEKDLVFKKPQGHLAHLSSSSPSLLMAAEGGVLYLCWSERTKGGEVLRVARSADQGLTFEQPADLATSSESISPTRLIIEGSTVAVAWLESYRPTGEGGRLHVATSANRGIRFTKPVQLSANARSMVSMAVDELGSVYAVWIDGGGELPAVVFSRSDDAGKSFSSPANIFHSRGGLVQFAQFSGDRERLSVVWKAEAPEPGHKSDILYSASTDRGRTFSPPQNLSRTAGNSTLPAMAVAGSGVYAVWADDTPGNYEIFFTKSPP